MEKLLQEQAGSAGMDENSHIGELLKDRKGPLRMDPDGTATTSEVAREELGSYMGGDETTVTLTREAFDQGIRIHNAEMVKAGHLSQIMEPVLPVNADENGNRLGKVKVYTISSEDESALSSPPLTTNYGGSEISFRSQTPGERVLSPLPTTNYEGSLLGLPPSALPQDPFLTPKASAGIIARRYIQSEDNISQHVEKQEGMEETQKVYTPILRKFEISDSSDDGMTEVEWRDESPYMTPTKKGKSAIRGRE